MKTVISFILLIFYSVCEGQESTPRIQQIEKYKILIDGLIQDDRQQDFIVPKLEEGKLSQESVTEHSDNRKATDTIKHSGGFSILSHTSGDSRKIFKVEYHDNLFENLYVILYYQNNTLVYGRVEYKSSADGSLLFSREEYYQRRELLHKKITGCFCGTLQQNRPNLNLLDESIKYTNALSALN